MSVIDVVVTLLDGSLKCIKWLTVIKVEQYAFFQAKAEGLNRKICEINIVK